MKKRLCAIALAFVLVLSMYIPTGAFDTRGSKTENPDYIRVIYNNGFHVADSGLSVNSTSVDSEILFEQDHLNFYKTDDSRFSPDFRLVLQDNGTVIPVEATVVNLNSDDPAGFLIDDYGYSRNSQFVRDLEQLVYNGGDGISAITVYTRPSVKSGLAPTDYTTVYKGKTMATDFMEVDGSSGTLQTVVAHGKNTVEDFDDMCNTEVSFDGFRTYGLISATTVIKFFGSALLRAYIDEWNNPSTYTDDTIREYTTYTNILRYTNVVENGSEYLGCISNCVYADCTLYYCPAGAGSSGNLRSENYTSTYYESDHYQETEAFEAAFDNYLNNPIIDRIEQLKIRVDYPSGAYKYVYERVSYF